MAPDEEGAGPEAPRREASEAEMGVLARPGWFDAFEERFRLFANAAPIFVWMAGPDALVRFVNRAWLELRGRSEQEELGNGWLDGLHPDDRPMCLEAYLKGYSSRQPFRFTSRVSKASGDYAWVHACGLPCFDGETFIGLIVVALDIGEWRRPFFAPDEEAARVVFSLTERERQVLVLIANGSSTKEAAANLGIGYKTADSHRSRILEKLGVHETASMVRYAIRAGLIAP